MTDSTIGTFRFRVVSIPYPNRFKPYRSSRHNVFLRMVTYIDRFF